MKNYISSAAFIFIIWLQTENCFGQSRTWEIGVAGGATYNFPTPLRIQQEGQEEIKLNARYRTEPFSLPVYYDIRVNTWQENKGWAVKFTHHKIILENRPTPVQRFSITDGFNLLTFNRLWRKNNFSWSLGGGIVITHPESTIRNKPFPENKGLFHDGYYISGPTLEAAVAKQYYFFDKWFVMGEGRITGSWVRVPVIEGHADVTNVALHFLGGFGFKIKNK